MYMSVSRDLLQVIGKHLSELIQLQPCVLPSSAQTP